MEKIFFTSRLDLQGLKIPETLIYFQILPG